MLSYITSVPWKELGCRYSVLMRVANHWDVLEITSGFHTRPRLSRFKEEQKKDTFVYITFKVQLCKRSRYIVRGSTLPDHKQL